MLWRALFPGLVRMQYRGRLGNRLAQYCLGRRLANELGFDLDAPAIPGFPRAVPLGGGRRGHLPLTRRQVVRTHHELDLPELVSDRRPRLIELRGLFLRYEYFSPCKSEIRDWLWSGPVSPDERDALTIHIRSGDIWRSAPVRGSRAEYHALPFSFYARIVEERGWSRIRVVTENGFDPMVQKLARCFRAEVISGAVLDDFNLLRSSRNLVLSVSSFAWWAAWLSDAERIYFPLLGLFDPERARRRSCPWRQDLEVIDEPRYIRRPVDAPRSAWEGSSADRARLLES